MVFAITERDAGSNSHRISTTAARDGDSWVLSGTRYYISGVDEATRDRRRKGAEVPVTRRVELVLLLLGELDVNRAPAEARRGQSRKFSNCRGMPKSSWRSPAITA